MFYNLIKGEEKHYESIIDKISNKRNRAGKTG